MNLTSEQRAFQDDAPRELRLATLGGLSMGYETTWRGHIITQLRLRR
jgi:hypothetical protein